MASSRSRVEVALGSRGYPIWIGSGAWDDVDQALAAVGDVSHAVLITDETVASLCADALCQRLASQLPRVDRLLVPPGEPSKSIAEFQRLCQEMLRCGADRSTLVVACGGGVVGDLAGFVAASFARGVRLLQAPTTLLAQVDSSVGGKVGVNLPGAKNMVGAFWQPSAVLIDIDTLGSLPSREFAAGMAEVVKYGVILDADFFEFLEQHLPEIRRRDAAVLQRIVTRCCQLKAEVVGGDERELTGLRAVLNYGHTFCHAIEAETRYERFLHGEAVAIGMLCASRLAAAMGRIAPELTDRQQRLLEALDLPVDCPGLSQQALLTAMRRDKKAVHGRLRFVLPSRLGHVELVADVDPQLVAEALAPATADGGSH